MSSINRVRVRSAHLLDGGSFTDAARTAERSRTAREEGREVGDAYRVDDPRPCVADLARRFGPIAATAWGQRIAFAPVCIGLSCHSFVASLRSVRQMAQKGLHIQHLVDRCVTMAISSRLSYRPHSKESGITTASCIRSQHERVLTAGVVRVNG